MSASLEAPSTRGDALVEALEALLTEAKTSEVPPPSLCLKVARNLDRQGDRQRAAEWIFQVASTDTDFTSYVGGAQLARKYTKLGVFGDLPRRRLALLGSYTVETWMPLLQLACLRAGLQVEEHVGLYGQYQQEILDENSAMYRHNPDVIVLAVNHRDVQLPAFSSNPREDVIREGERWVQLWKQAKERSRAAIIQHSFAIPAEMPFGHLGGTLPGTRYSMMRALNVYLGEQAAAHGVGIVDCEQLASIFGKSRWFDHRYWNVAKHAVSMHAQPFLARHTAAVVAASAGLSRKCLVVDLDNTLWGGIIGEDGLVGIRLGSGVDGEAFVAFQEYLLALKQKGVILAVCSKNNEADALEPFEKHPEMRLRADDFAVFVANWKPKPGNIEAIAQTLNIGLDSLVFVDDNPAEREAVRRALPQVEVITLPADPSGYLSALGSYTGFETSIYTPEDANRTDMYRARAEITEARASGGSLEDFLGSLSMEAIVRPFDEFHLPRIAQLTGKTNQFNLTTRRHTQTDLQRFAEDPNCVHLFLRLRDRIADHGLVSVLIAFQENETLDIDTWLMSCRVLGRKVEAEMLSRVSEEAIARGCRWLTGTYIPTAKNALVRDLFGQSGFEQISEENGSTKWRYDLGKNGAAPRSGIIAQGVE